MTWPTNGFIQPPAVSSTNITKMNGVRNIYLTAASSSAQNIMLATTTPTFNSVYLPDATTLLPSASPAFVFTNAGLNNIFIRRYDGRLIIILLPNGSCSVSLINNNTQAGRWTQFNNGLYIQINTTLYTGTNTLWAASGYGCKAVQYTNGTVSCGNSNLFFHIRGILTIIPLSGTQTTLGMNIVPGYGVLVTSYDLSSIYWTVFRINSITGLITQGSSTSVAANISASIASGLSSCVLSPTQAVTFYGDSSTGNLKAIPVVLDGINAPTNGSTVIMTSSAGYSCVCWDASCAVNSTTAFIAVGNNTSAGNGWACTIASNTITPGSPAAYTASKTAFASTFLTAEGNVGLISTNGNAFVAAISGTTISYGAISSGFVGNSTETNVYANQILVGNKVIYQNFTNATGNNGCFTINGTTISNTYAGVPNDPLKSGPDIENNQFTSTAFSPTTGAAPYYMQNTTISPSYYGSTNTSFNTITAGAQVAMPVAGLTSGACSLGGWWASNSNQDCRFTNMNGVVTTGTCSSISSAQGRAVGYNTYLRWDLSSKNEFMEFATL